MLKLSGGVPAPAPAFTYYDAAGPGSVLAGGAAPRVVNGSATVVGFVGSGGTLTLTGVDGGAAGGTKLLAVDYINADVTFSNTACSNCRNAFFSVNGGPAVQAQMPLSGQVRLCAFLGRGAARRRAFLSLFYFYFLCYAHVVWFRCRAGTSFSQGTASRCRASSPAR